MTSERERFLIISPSPTSRSQPLVEIGVEIGELSSIMENFVVTFKITKKVSCGHLVLSNILTEQENAYFELEIIILEAGALLG